ncbi:MAG: protease complex subunit PrcB family protein [Elusimicrobiota bacterium]|nr:protease complex subunit PrcB family protein [Elusimicrobiota bacterium]
MIELALIFALASHAAPAPKKPAPKAEAKAAAAPAAKEKKPMEWKGQYGGPGEAGHRLITDARGWEALWRVLGKDAPSLDFKTHAAVAVFIGEKPTGGWTATFEEPKVKDGDTLITYTVLSPKGFTTQAFTQPYIVRALPKPAKGRIVVIEAKEE